MITESSRTHLNGCDCRYVLTGSNLQAVANYVCLPTLHRGIFFFFLVQLLDVAETKCQFASQCSLLHSIACLVVVQHVTYHATTAIALLVTAM